MIPGHRIARRERGAISIADMIKIVTLTIPAGELLFLTSGTHTSALTNPANIATAPAAQDTAPVEAGRESRAIHWHIKILSQRMKRWVSSINRIYFTRVVIMYVIHSHLHPTVRLATAWRSDTP